MRGIKDIQLEELTTYELIDVLDEIFPRELHSPNDRMEVIMHKAGRRDLIEILLLKKEREINGKRNTEISV